MDKTIIDEEKSINLLFIFYKMVVFTNSRKCLIIGYLLT
jgi:hypothetical protein